MRLDTVSPLLLVLVAAACSKPAGSSLLPIEQSRSGNVITLEIKRQRPRDAICTQIAKLFDQDIRLPGEFRTGDYTLNVNGSPSSFQVP